MSDWSPLSPDELKRRSVAALFLKVHDLDEDRIAGAAHPPVVRLCNLIIGECLLSGGDQLRILSPVGAGAPIQFHRAGVWVDVMSVPAQVQAPLVNRFKVMANLDVARHPVQEGTLKVRLRGQAFSFAIEVRLQGDAEEVSLHLPPGTAISPPSDSGAAT